MYNFRDSDWLINTESTGWIGQNFTVNNYYNEGYDNVENPMLDK